MKKLVKLIVFLMILKPLQLEDYLRQASIEDPQQLWYLQKILRVLSWEIEFMWMGLSLDEFNT